MQPQIGELLRGTLQLTFMAVSVSCVGGVYGIRQCPRRPHHLASRVSFCQGSRVTASSVRSARESVADNCPAEEEAMSGKGSASISREKHKATQWV